MDWRDVAEEMEMELISVRCFWALVGAGLVALVWLASWAWQHYGPVITVTWGG